MARPSFKDVTLTETCYIAPEAYDAHYKGEYVGRVRMRHGKFTVRDECENILFFKDFSDPLRGYLEDDERKKYLRKARKKIWKHILAD